MSKEQVFQLITKIKLQQQLVANSLLHIIVGGSSKYGYTGKKNAKKKIIWKAIGVAMMKIRTRRAQKNTDK